MIIGIDLQTLETPEANRGIGRFARGITENLARLCAQHRIVGFGFGDQPPRSLDCTELENFEYRRFDLPHGRKAYLSAGILAPFGWSPQMCDLDLYLVTSPLMPDILLTDGAPFPVVALMHDLILLRFRQSHPEQMDEYQWELYDARLEVAKNYDFYLSNSEATRQDVCRLLGVAAERICPIGVGVGEEFFEAMSESALGKVRAKCAIGSPYVLSVTGHHYRKNWEAVLRSFAALPASDRKAYQLVVVCRLDARGRHELAQMAENEGITSRTVLTDAVDDETLRGLYQGAAALLFPSLAEGFGMPLIEAMAAGVPIVASDIAVFHEVAGEAARLVDPLRPDLLAQELHAVLRDKRLREDLIEKGRQRVENYRWPGIIERAEPFLSRVAAPRPAEPAPVRSPAAGRAPHGERVAYSTLLPPQVSGIADYNESLVRELAKHVRLELFLDDVVPAHREIRERIVWHRSHDFPRIHGQEPFDLVVYHIGNNALHGYQYRLATTFPGIVVLHDYCLRFFAPLANRRFSFLETRDDIEQYYGLTFPPNMPPEHIFEQLTLGDHPLNEKLIERSVGVIVHSQWSRDRIHRRFPDKPVEVVPSGIDPDPRANIRPRQALRQSYQIAPKAFVVTCAGYLTKTKRLTTVLHAFAEIVDEVPEALLCLVGQATDPRYFQHLQQLVGRLGLAGYVRFWGYVELEELYDMLDMSDVCLNLRYPTLGETSAVMLRMMQLGKPVIASAIAQFLEFPDTVCWKADIGGAERMQLVRYLRAFARSPELRATIGDNARRYVQEWTWDRVALLHIEAWQKIARHASIVC